LVCLAEIQPLNEYDKTMNEFRFERHLCLSKSIDSCMQLQAWQIAPGHEAGLTLGVQFQ